MDAKKLETFKNKLLREKRLHEAELKEIVGENIETALEQGAVGGDENFEDHMGDVATTVFDQERDLSLERNTRDILARVNEALRKIDESTYGICTSCGRPIDEARLRALPWADLCIDCKQKEEKRF